MNSKRIHNFSAGPAVLPEEVIEQAQRDLWDLASTGIGVAEHSHRGAALSKVLEEAVADCRTIAGIGDDHEVLFLQGGASSQFFMVPMNFLGKGQSADYLNTGSWSKKAIQEALNFGDVNVAFDGSDHQFDHIPTADEIRPGNDPVYLHYTSNNTIFGTQYRDEPGGEVPLVVDASSDIFSRPIDVARHGLIYAGAQKNLGPAGVTLAIIRKDFLEMGKTDVPTMLRYSTHAEKDSCYNTPPTFAIYVMGRVFRWILDQGGLSELAGRNAEKAQLIYDAVDGSGGFYRPVARTDSRSHMNVCFQTPDGERDATFVKEAMAVGMSGLKGHRSVGGLRASIYNACPRASCERLVDFMKEFATKNG